MHAVRTPPRRRRRVYVHAYRRFENQEELLHRHVTPAAPGRVQPGYCPPAPDGPLLGPGRTKACHLTEFPRAGFHGAELGVVVPHPVQALCLGFRICVDTVLPKQPAAGVREDGGSRAATTKTTASHSSISPSQATATSRAQDTYQSTSPGRAGTTSCRSFPTTATSRRMTLQAALLPVLRPPAPLPPQAATSD